MRGFRVLVVEDLEEVLVQLRQLLGAALPHSTVEEASTVEGAFSRVDVAVANGEPYDLVILDFKLPNRSGEMADVDESVCLKLTRSMPDAIVGHITTFAEDKRIFDHLTRAHLSGRFRAFFQDKMKPDFASSLVRVSREALYGSQIEREMGDLFLSRDAPRSDIDEARSVSHRRSGSVSNRIADLCLDIADVWTYLGSATKERVQQHFLVREEPDRVSVVLK